MFDRNCPVCGVTLEPRLVAAIKDPNREESCPRQRPLAIEPSDDLLIELRALLAEVTAA